MAAATNNVTGSRVGIAITRQEISSIRFHRGIRTNGESAAPVEGELATPMPPAEMRSTLLLDVLMVSIQNLRVPHCRLISDGVVPSHGPENAVVAHTQLFAR